MSFLTFTLLLVGLFWLATIHLLNSSSPAGDLARQFVRGLIERIVSRPKELPSDDINESDPPERLTNGKTK
jgi:hypothetical protein